MRPPALDLAAYLAGKNGLGALHGDKKSTWPVHVAVEPDDPRSVITLYDTTGIEPDTDELDIERPSIQVRARSPNYEDAYEKMRAVRDLLILEPVEAQTSRFFLIVLRGDIMAIGRDDKNNHILTANYSCQRTAKEA